MCELRTNTNAATSTAIAKPKGYKVKLSWYVKGDVELTYGFKLKLSGNVDRDIELNKKQ